MASTASLLDCLAAAYRVDLSGEAYVRNVVEKAVPLLDRGLGVMAYTYEVREAAPPVIDHFVTSERFDSRWLERFYGAVAEAGLESQPENPAGFEAWGHLLCEQASAVPGMRPFLPHFTHIGGARDTFAINALDASGHGLWLGAPLRSTRKVSAARRTLFTRFAAHLTAATRIRRNAGRTGARTVAVLSPAGELLEAAGGDSVVDARDMLRRATLAFDQAHTKKARGDVATATQRWRPLVDSRWSLLDDFDTDGRRFVVAVENGPPTRPPRRDLSEREHQVLTQAHLGHSDKVIAYELGLSASTVRVLLHRAARKLGASSRKDALARFNALRTQRSGLGEP